MWTSAGALSKGCQSIRGCMSPSPSDTPGKLALCAMVARAADAWCATLHAELQIGPIVVFWLCWLTGTRSALLLCAGVTLYPGSSRF